MPLNVRNILVGVGELFTADEGVVFPGETAAGETDFSAFVTHENTGTEATPVWTEYHAETKVYMDGQAVDATGADVPAPTGWTNVGLTQGGVTMSYEPTYGEVTVDQLADAALMFNESLSVMLNTTLVEATLDNLLVSWGLPTSAKFSGDSATNGFLAGLNLGSPGSRPVERQLLVSGNAPNVGGAVDGDPQERVYYGRRVASVEGSELALARSEATTYGVSFRLLPDAGLNNEFRNREYGFIVDRVVNVPTA